MEGEFKDPLGVIDPLRSDTAVTEGDDESTEEFDFDYYLSQISPTTTAKSLEHINVLSHNGGYLQSLRGAGAAYVDAETDERDLFVFVDNPEKHATTMESYVTFRVVTKTTRSEFEGTETQVRRRYNDFLWLRQRLEETQPTHIIPPLPEKHSLKRFDRFNQEFIRTRMIALQNFLQRIADHPVLSFDKTVFAFLTAKQSEFQAAKKEGTGTLTRWADTFHNMSAAYMMKNRTPEFTEATNYIYSFGEKLGALDRIFARILKEQFELLAEFNELGPVFTLWSNAEDKLAAALSAVAKSVEKCYIALQELVDVTEAEFNNPLKEYVLYAEAIKVVLRKRDALQMEYDMTVEELNRKKDEQETSNRLAESLNDKLTCADADLKADTDRWHKNKRKDFRRIFTSLADRQIQYYQKCLQAWEEVIPTIQKTDQDGSNSSSSHSSPKSNKDT